ncbi:hypothetical protein ACFQY5_10265 [Paeniroseomonas aquatica]|uniref:hypothetical protein n=1 Tax=Paeniroseomonas aquatica TaxID=373043 RepID=UPI00361141D4
MTRALGLEADRIRWIPSVGGAPALQDLVAGASASSPAPRWRRSPWPRPGGSGCWR